MKTILLKKTLLILCLVVSASSFGQIDYTFDSDDEGFAVAGAGGPSLTASGGLLIVTTGTGDNTQLRKNGVDVGDPTTLTTVIIDMKNNSNSDQFVLQTVAGGVTSIATIPITTGDTAEQTYRIDVPAGSNTWVGTFQLRLRFTQSGGADLDGGTIEINRIQIVDPTTLNTEEFLAEDFSIYPNPVSDFINVKLLKEAKVSIFNINGKLVKSHESFIGENRIDVSNLSAGVYLMELSSEGKSMTRKIILK